MSFNPYAPPKAAVEDIEPGVSAAEAIRREHIAHERQLKSVGLLYFFATFALGVSAVVPLAVGGSKVDGAVSLLVGAFAALSAVVGYGYRTLRPWVRVPGAILAVLGLLAVPVGTIINAYILYLMFCARGATVLAPEYAAVVAATPHVRYKRTVGDWIAIALVALFVGGMLIALVVGSM